MVIVSRSTVVLTTAVCIIWPVSMAAQSPDLMFSSPATLTVNPSSIDVGYQTKLPSFVIRNAGTGFASASLGGYYLSTDAVITTADVLLGNFNIPSLTFGNTVPISGPVLTIPTGTTAGNYYVGILLDVQNVLAETNEGNNYESTPLTVLKRADVTITSPAKLIVTPATSPAGGTISLPAITISNYGAAATPLVWNVAILSLDPTMDITDRGLGGVMGGPLNVGASSVLPARSIQVPADVAPGNYFLGVWVNYGNVEPELDYSNNTIVVPITVTGGSDLKITAPSPLSVTPSTVAAGSSVALPIITVSNLGVAPGTAAVGYYLSNDATFTASDIKLGGVAPATYYPGFPATIPAITLTIPASLPGKNYWLGVLVDDGNTAAESNEGNNTTGHLITVTGGPDLVVTPAALSVTPGTVGAGGKVTWPAWNMVNSGPAAATQITYGFYLSSDVTFSPDDRLLKDAVHPSLGSSASYAFPATALTIPGDVRPGAYRVILVLDPQNTIPESSDANNSRQTALTVVEGAELLISAPASLTLGSGTTAPGGTVALPAWKLKNTGTVWADARRTGFSANVIEMGYYLSADPLITGVDRRIGGAAAGPVSAGGEVTFPASSLTIPPDVAPGSYYAGILVDDREDVHESNESNNYKSVPLTITAPRDLVLTADAPFAATPAGVGRGAMFSLPAWKVTNTGVATDGSVHAGLYLSADPVITSADYRLQAIDLGALAANATVSHPAQSLKLPISLPIGSYQLGMLIDDAGAIPETNENNNTLVAPLAVRGGVDLSAPAAAFSVSPTTVLAGGAVSLRYSLTNTGTDDASWFMNGYYLSSDAAISTSDRRLDGRQAALPQHGGGFGTYYYAGFSPGDVSTEVYSGLRIPSDVAPGSYYIGVLADEADVIPEVDNGNNYASARLIVPAVLKYGNASEYPTGALLGGNLLVATRVVIGQNCSLTHLGVIRKLPVATQQLRLGLYTDAAGKPGNLLVSTSDVQAVAGVNELAAVASLPAGTYWLGMIASNPIRIGGAANTATVRRMIAVPFSAPLPATWPSSDAAATGLDFNWYAKVTIP